MATQTKIYTIEIQLDGARNALEDANKKLAALDNKLDGIGTDSKAGKAIVAQMALAASSVEKLTGQISGLETRLDGLKPGTIGALRQEVTDLEAALENTVKGSTEAAVVIQALGDKKSQLRELANAVNAANPRAQARAFTVLAGALTGVVGIATTAAQAFGLSSESAQVYAQKMQALVGVLYSVEQINRALNGENIALIKSIVASGKAWLTAGEAASTSAKVTRAALVASGIGIIILALAVAVGVITTNWDKLTGSVKGSVEFLTQFKAVASGMLDGAIAAVKTFAVVLGDVFMGDLIGAAKRASSAGKDIGDAYKKGYAESIRNSGREAIDLQIADYARQIDLAKAQGKNTLQQQIENAQRHLDNLKNETKDEKAARLDAANELAKLKAEQQVKDDEQGRALVTQSLSAEAQLRAAKGQESFAQQLAAKKEELAQLRDAIDQNQVAITAKEDEVAAFEAARAKDVDDKAAAAELARVDARLALTQAQGRQAFRQQVAREELALEFLRSSGIRNEAEIIAQVGKIAALKAAHQREEIEKAHATELAGLDASISLQQTKGADAFADQVKREERALAFLEEAGTKNRAAIIAQQSKIDNLRAAHAKKEQADIRAASIARLQVELGIAQANGQETTAFEIRIKEKELAGLLAAADRNEAAIILKDGELAALRIKAAQKNADTRRALLEELQGYELALYEKQGKDTLDLRIRQAQALLALDIDTSEKGLKQKRKDIADLDLLLYEKAHQPLDFGANILQKLFGVSDEDIPKTKEAINKAFSELEQTLVPAVNALLSEGVAAADTRIQQAQSKLSELDSQLSEVAKNRQNDEAALATATGARRDYLLKKLEAERAAESKLAAQKAATAKQEQEAAREKARLEKEQQQISAASTAIEAVLLGIKAAQTLVDIADKGKFGIDNIALAVAATATLGTGIFALRNAAKTFGGGGLLEGPRHGQGGIPFTIAGRAGFEAEGGEFIINRAATANNRSLLETINQAGRTRALAPATGQGLFAAGGMVSAGSSLPGSGSAASGASAELLELRETNRQILAQLAAVASHTDQIRSYGPAHLYFGHEAEVQRRLVANEVDSTQRANQL